MIGRYLVPLLIESNNNVTVASLDGKNLPSESKFKRLDLRDINNCLDVCEGMDEVITLELKVLPKCAENSLQTFLSYY